MTELNNEVLESTIEMEVLSPLQIANQRFKAVESLGLFGTSLDHAPFFAELERQRDNRRDYFFETGQVHFDQTKFVIGNRSYDLDQIALQTLAERFKVNGAYTVTKNGLYELSKTDTLFEQVSNHFLHMIDKPLQFRTLYDVGIAFPSQKYTIVNHIDLMSMILNTLTTLFEVEAHTYYNYLGKDYMYSFIPLPDCERILRYTSNNYPDKVTLGLEVRNSEVLQNGISINFKVIREMNSSGFVLSDSISNVYQRHINLSTEDALNKVQRGLLDMFQDEGIPLAMSAIENLSTLMNTTVSSQNGESVVREFARMLGLSESDSDNLVQAGLIQNDETLFGWTLGPMNYIAQARNNRYKQENDEKLSGKILLDEQFFSSIMELRD